MALQKEHEWQAFLTGAKIADRGRLPATSGQYAIFAPVRTSSDVRRFRRTTHSIMNLNLDKDIIFFDIESTGLNIVRDRIIQLAMVRHHADGRPPEERTYLIHPGMPIPAEASAVHKITDADVDGQLRFAAVAKEILDFIGDADLAGYNSNRFDIPLLMEEFARAGYAFDVDHRRTIDVQRIFYRMEPRTLAAAYQFYCQKPLTQAHDALADVKATIEVLDGQLDRYADADLVPEEGETLHRPVRPDVQCLHDFTTDPQSIDATNRLKLDHNGTIVFNFGKHAGRPVADVFRSEPQYFQWMMAKEFSQQVKRIISDIAAQLQHEK